MATTIITKHSATAKDPQPSQLERGELAIDLERKNIYTKDASDAVVQLAESQWKDNGNDIYYDDGNVGIGTDNPTQPLDISASMGGTGAGPVVRVTETSGGARNGIHYTATGPTNSAVDVLRIEDAVEVLFNVKGGGTVGVGTDIASPFRFNVSSASSTTTNLQSTSGSSVLRLTNSGGLATIGSISSDLNFTTGTVERMRIAQDGILSFSSTSSASFPPRSINCYSNGYMYVTGGSSGMILADGSTGSTRVRINSQDLQFETNGSTQMTIDSAGRLGIGGEPGTRTAGEYLEQAKTRLEGWKTTFDDRLKAEPKADKKAVTLEITDGDFSVFPKAEVLAEKMAERAIGGGDAKLQVAGDIYGSGHLAINAPVQSNISIYSSQNGSRTHAGWFQANGNTGTAMQIRGTASAQSSATCIIETTGSSPTGNTLVVNHKGTGRALDVTGDGYFSGNVNANAFNSNNFRGVAFYNTPAGTNGIRFSTAGQLRPTDNTGTAKDDVLSLGSENFRFKDAHFSGNVNAENVICDQVRGTASGRAGLEFISSSRIVPVDNTGVITDGAANLGSTTGRFNNAYFSGIIRTGSGTTSETGAQIGPAVYSRNAASDGTVANEVWRGYGADVITSRIRSNGDAYFSGTVHAQQFMRDGNPVPTTLDLIETLATLRNATKDEDTLEGLRDALGDAIGGLIQKFEAIQA